MAGVRENALVAVANQLKKIQVANGYANDVMKVFRQDFKVEMLDQTETPAVFVLPPLGGGRLEHQQAEWYVYRWGLTCGAIIKRTPTNEKDEQGETDMESLVNDLWRSLLEDPTFGGTSTSGIHDSVLTDGPYFFDPDLGAGVYNCTLQVDLVFQRSDL